MARWGRILFFAVILSLGFHGVLFADVNGYTSYQSWIDAVTNKGWSYYNVDTGQVTATLDAGSALSYGNGSGSVSFNTSLTRAADELFTYDNSILIKMLSTGSETSVDATFAHDIDAFGVFVRPTGTPPEGWGYVMGVGYNGSGFSMGAGPEHNEFLGLVLTNEPAYNVFNIVNNGSLGAEPSGFVFGNMVVSHRVVPEPASFFLFGLGAAALGFVRRAKNVAKRSK